MRSITGGHEQERGELGCTGIALKSHAELMQKTHADSLRGRLSKTSTLNAKTRCAAVLRLFSVVRSTLLHLVVVWRPFGLKIHPDTMNMTKCALKARVLIGNLKAF